MDGHMDDAKTISLRIRGGIKNTHTPKLSHGGPCQPTDESFRSGVSLCLRNDPLSCNQPENHKLTLGLQPGLHTVNKGCQCYLLSTM